MLELRTTSQFKKDLKKLGKQRKPMSKLAAIVEMLRKEKPLPCISEIMS
jgi:mRNA-degrading endonuclease YafQ of YafQ-DinJ toxin-antitoxin module